MSWNLSIGRDFLPDVSVRVLKNYISKEGEAKPRVRLLCALRRKQGWSIDEIAGSLELPRRTVHGTLWRFVEHGLGAVYDAPRAGRPHYLTLKQREDLRRRLLAGPQANGFREGSWGTRMVLHVVEQRYGRHYTREHMTRLLHKLGFSRQKPRPVNARKPSKKEIRAFKKKRAGWYPTT